MKKLPILFFATMAIFAVTPANAQRVGYVHVVGVEGPVPLLRSEPPPGTLRFGQVVVVLNTNGYCAPGYGLKLTGAPNLGTPRGRACIPRGQR